MGQPLDRQRPLARRDLQGNDNFYLEATSTNSSRPDAGTIAGGSYADAYGTAALSANTWSFLTETYDGSTLRLYVNGTQVASTAHTGSIATSTNPLQIGGDSLYGQYFAGLIDNVRVYNIALTAAQIQTDEATPIGSSGGDTTPPSAPGTLTATAASSGEVDLSWGAATDNVGVTGYDIERCTGASCTTFAQIAATSRTGTTYKDTSVSRPPAIATASAPSTLAVTKPLLQHRQRHHSVARHDPAVGAGDADRDGGRRAARSTCPGAPRPTTSAWPAT